MIGAVSNGTAIRSVYRTHDDLEFHYFEAGRFEAPPMLLIHGFMAHSMAYRRVVDALGAHYRLILPDLPAHGLDGSFRDPRVTPDFESLVAWAHRLSELFDGPLHLVGHSLGAALAYVLARDHGALSLSLVSPGFKIPPSKVGSVALDRFPASVATLAANRLGLAFYGPLNWRGEPMSREEERAYLAPLRSAERAGFMLRVGARLLEPTDPIPLGPIDVPTQIVWGELDHILPIENAHWAVDRLGGDVPLTVVPGSGHSPMEDRPDDFARLIRDFATAHDA